jgi:hypothetical protein
VTIAKVDCVSEAELCRDQRIMAFPSMRFFKNGQPVNAADYRADRTVEALMDFTKRKVLFVCLFFFPSFFFSSNQSSLSSFGILYLIKSIYNCCVCVLMCFSFLFFVLLTTTHHHIKLQLELEAQYQKWPEARKAHAQNWNPDHPGCLLVGFLLVNRVPGNFHIEVTTYTL